MMTSNMIKFRVTWIDNTCKRHEVSVMFSDEKFNHNVVKFNLYNMYAYFIYVHVFKIIIIVC